MPSQNGREIAKLLAMASDTSTAGTLAQSVEQRTENPCVPGSIPGGTTKEVLNSFKTLETPLNRGFCFYEIS